MDLDAIPMGLHDYEKRLLWQVKKMLHFSNIIHVSIWIKIIHDPSLKNCSVSKEKETGNFVKKWIDSEGKEKPAKIELNFLIKEHFRSKHSKIKHWVKPFNRSSWKEVKTNVIVRLCNKFILVPSQLIKIDVKFELHIAKW